MPSATALPWLTSTPPPTRRVGAPRRRIPVRRLRLAGAAACAFVATWLVLRLVMPAPPPHVVLTAARDLPAGYALTAADLTTTRVTDDIAPDGAPADPQAVVGRRLARPMAAHEILTSSALTVATAIAPTERVVHVPVADPGALAALHPGDRVDLVEGGTGRVVAAAARILTVDDPTAEKGGHGLAVAVPQADVTRLVPAMGSDGPGVTPALRNSDTGTDAARRLQ